MTQPRDEEIVAQSEVAEVARQLANLRYRLKTIAADLPVPPERGSAGDLDREPSLAVELRSAIDCVVTDCLNPAIGDLEKASLYRPGTAARKDGNGGETEASS